MLSENWVGLKDPQGEVRTPFPRPDALGETQGVLPVAWGAIGGAAEAGGGWALLVQSEWGDLYRVSLKAGAPPTLTIQVLDHVPPATALVVLAGGRVMYAALEMGDEVAYMLGEGEGEGGQAPAVEGTPLMEDGMNKAQRVGDGAADASTVAPAFTRAGAGVSMKEVWREPGLAGVTHLVNSGPGRLVALCGRGSGSTLRVLESGLSVVQEFETTLAAAPLGVWAVRDQYVVLSFSASTLVLEVTDAIMREMNDRGFITDVKTIEVSRWMSIQPSCL